jgi:hypothetical protein
MNRKQVFGGTGKWGVATVVIALAMGLAGCLPIPLGDPETSKVDDGLVGVWILKGAENDTPELLAVMKYDARTYLVSDMKFAKRADGGYVSRGQVDSKAWLTTVAGETFVTAELKDPKLLVEDTGKAFYVAKLTRHGDEVKLQAVDEQFIKDANVTKPAELTKVITENVKNPKLYEADAATFAKAGPDKADALKAIFDSFANPPAQNQ